ncbi:MAG: glycosyltransferase [Pyrinomonadaceae bacterium]
METALQALIINLVDEHSINDYVLWYYTPMALGWTRQLNPLAVVYDCMDELSAFKNAPIALREREAELFSRADVVFTGGQSLYEAKRHQHPNVYAFPSSVETAHFASARHLTEDPVDQVGIPHPRIGFYGVIDERFDIALLKGVAEARPEWHWVVVGPIVKINPADLPKLENVHYLCSKSYQELPAYLAGWDVAVLPFARNESTRFISPTKTPEYLAAGKPVVSTSIRDVVRPYQELGLARIADAPEEFIAAIEAALGEDATERIRRADKFLAQNSWDRTWRQMSQLIDDAVKTRLEAAQAVKQAVKQGAMRVAGTKASAASFATGD